MNEAAQLRAVLAAFRDEVKPELTSPQTKFRAELINMLLTRLAVRADGGDVGELYWEEVAPLLKGWPKGDVAPRAVALADMLGSTAEDQARLRRVIAIVADAERTRRVALEDKVAENLTALPRGKRSVTETSVSVAEVTAYLRARFPEDASVTAMRVTTVPGGRSKITILLEVTSASGKRDIVVRKDFELGSAGVSVRAEYPVIVAAFKAGLPVPEPLWLEEDQNPIGGKFIAFARVPGMTMGTLFHSDASPAFARACAAGLAKLHAIDLAEAGLGDSLRWAREVYPVTALIEHFYERYRKLPPNPLMDAAFAWLRLKLPEIGNAKALVHGDASFHNLMGEGDRLTALLDWEFSHAGDPAEDLAYCKYLAERILPWEEFMGAYLAAGGQPVSQARMDFFTLWRTLHLAVHTAAARQDFDSGEDQDLRKAAIGYNTYPKQLRDLAVDLSRLSGLN